MKKTGGFTLIELMIVVAILAILASIAVTAYSRYATRAQLAEAFSVAEGLKNNVLTDYQQGGRCPAVGDPTSGLATTPASYGGKYVASADVSSANGDCLVTISMRSSTVAPALRGKQIVFASSPSSGGVSAWKCSSDVSEIYLPRTCQ